MALEKFWLLFYFIVLLLHSGNVKASKLNVPRVLLPIFNDVSPKFILEATEGGCYKWTTTRPDIIQITLIQENQQMACSAKIQINSITKDAARNIAVVLGEEASSKQSLRCDVIVDAINSLSITTTTKELFMEEAPEDFEVKAFDDQGNEFSTLEGVEFEWNIIPLGSTKDIVVRYIRFRDSPYETPPHIEALETEQKKGYKILLEGIKTGSAKITVRLPYLEYKHVPACDVQLMIVANLLLTPAEVYIMPGDEVMFNIYFINNGRMEEVNLRKSQYFLQSLDTNVATSSKGSGVVKAIAEGKTKVILKDKNVGNDDPGLKFPTASVNVVKPDYMIMNILPHKNWAVLVNDYHDIVTEVYSSSDHKLYLGSNVKANIDISKEFYVSSRSSNGTWVNGCGLKPGIALVQGTLLSIADDKVKLEKPIEAKADLMIYPRITIEPSDVILPWDPVSQPKYEVDLIARGGDGKFLWTSSNHSIGVVSQTGHVRTFTDGLFEVSAVMLRNHHNRQNAKVLIIPPTRLEIIEYVMEAEVGSMVYLHIAMYADQMTKDGRKILVPFTRCQDLPFEIKQTDAKFRQNKSMTVPPVGSSCANIAMLGMNVGTTKVTVAHDFEGRVLEDSVTISAYRPLLMIQPKRDIVLAVGSSINLVFTGGPRPMIGRAAEFQRVVISENEAIARAQDMTQFHTIPGEDFTVVEVVCKKLGETDVKLMITNNPSALNCKSQTSEILTRVICGKPRKITLQPDLKIPDVTACPMDLSSGNVVVQSTKPITLDVSVFDDCGNRFLNISSLNLRWHVEPPACANVVSPDSVFPQNITIGTVAIADRSQQLLMPLKDTGNIVVNVTIAGYLPLVLKKNKITPEWPEFVTDDDHNTELRPITASLNLALVEDHSLIPSSLKLLGYHGNKEKISVTQGSGYFEIALSADDIVDVNYVENTKTLEITPLKSGKVMIQMIDLCIVSPPAILTVSVYTVGRIELEMLNKVEIRKCIECHVRVYDEHDDLMDVSDSDSIDLQSKMEKKIINVHKGSADSNATLEPGELRYIATGIEVGETSFAFTASANGKEVSSNTVNVQVFEPLRLTPRNATIIISASIQMHPEGGLSDSDIIYNTTSPTIVDVSPEGQVKGAKIGKAIVTAQARGIHPFTGQTIIYSEDTVEVKVILLQAIRISSPVTLFTVGSTVPFHCHGIPDVSPLVLGTIDEEPNSIQWKVDDSLLADLTGVFHPLGVNIRRLDRITLKLTGLQSGKTKVVVNLTLAGKILGYPKERTRVLSASIDIEILEKFALELPRFLYAVNLLMAPHSETQLVTNLDNKAEITYILEGDDAQSTEIAIDGNSTDVLATVSQTGLVKSYGKIGNGLLEIISIDERGVVQKLNFVVEVKEVYYISLLATADWKITMNTRVQSVPLGTSFFINVNFHDALGTTFQAGPAVTKVLTSRNDLIKMTHFVQNSSILVETKKPGSTVLKVFIDSSENMRDYVKIHVEQLVKPQMDYLTVGDTVCLWTPVVSKSHLPGEWRSSNEEIVEINPAIDIAFVLRPGTVVLTHSLLASAPLQIEVYPVTEIEFLASPDTVITNGDKDTVDRLLVVLQSEKSMGVKVNNLIQGWRCKGDVRKIVRPHGFNCFMKFENASVCITAEELFNITSSWIPETGQYACKLISKGVNNSDIAVLRTNLTVWAVTEDENVRSPDFPVSFVPSVYVPNEIFLAENTNIGVLKVVGLSEVLEQIQVTPADSSIIFVDKGSISSATTRSYQVQLIDYHWRLADKVDTMGILVVSPLTKQDIIVMVKVTGQLTQFCGRSPLIGFIQNYKYAFLLAFTMLVVFFVTFFFYSTYMQPVVNVNVAQTQDRLLPTLSAKTTSTTAPTFRCAANLAAARYAALNRTAPEASSAGHSHSPGHTCNCGGARNPVFGDPSSFYTSTPDARRNRRAM